jgi:hypothetical protein
MQFRIADSISGSLSRLNSEEQKLAKTTAFDLKFKSSNPGHRYAPIGEDN